ncbi:MAG: tRNA (N6-threonylcarbamoyladenosine(37)-N6)-methyltransferase TrmO [Thermoplasmata archaeon]
MAIDLCLKPIGFVRSKLKSRRAAPSFYTDEAPEAFIEVVPDVRRALLRIQAGDELIVITWLHHARRKVLTTSPEDDRSRPRTGVFRTRSPDRPNPLGLHRCRVVDARKDGLHIDAIEAIEGTPVVDIKPVVEEGDDS